MNRDLQNLGLKIYLAKVQRWETGQKMPTEKEIPVLAEYLGLKPTDLKKMMDAQPINPNPFSNYYKKALDILITTEDLKFLTKVSEGFSKPLTLKLVAKLLEVRHEQT